MSRPKRDLRVLAHEPFGLALVVRQDAVVAGVDGRVIEPRTDFRSLAVAQEVHHVAAAPQIAIQQALAQRRIDEIHQLDRARVERDRSRLTAGTGHAIDAAVLDPAARQLHREHAANGTAADDQDGNL